MDLDTLQFIRQALPSGRTLYYDFPDRYAQLLLQQHLGNEQHSIADIKASRFAPLLKKPCIERVVANVGRPWLCADDLLLAWPQDPQTFKLSLGTWPGMNKKPQRRWSQVTRLGWSLVLQLNVVSGHKQALTKEVPSWEDYTTPWHPIARRGELTLAWARIDLDFETGEALIEEIQSDWVRDVEDYISYYSDSTRNWRAYRDATLRPLARKWPDTMLTAALWFLFEELGISRVFYHTYQTGMQLKRIKYRGPPRSLYRELPRRLCFRTTHNGPAFIRDTQDKETRRLFTEPETKWFVHDFGG